jgi:hypothetical protein
MRRFGVMSPNVHREFCNYDKLGSLLRTPRFVAILKLGMRDRQSDLSVLPTTLAIGCGFAAAAHDSDALTMGRPNLPAQCRKAPLRVALHRR